MGLLFDLYMFINLTGRTNFFNDYPLYAVYLHTMKYTVHVTILTFSRG